MLPTTQQARPWLRSPRGLVIALGVTTTLSAGALTWFAWEILQQEQTVETERERERLGNRADQVAQAIDRVLADITDLIAAYDGPPSSARSFASAPPPAWLSTEGLVLVLDRSSLVTIPPAKLRFYPVVPSRPEPPASLFDEGETAEFRQRDLLRAIGSYRSLARSPDPAVRAAALMRLGGR